MEGVAVNTTFELVQTAPLGLALIVRPGVSMGLMVMVTVSLVTVSGTAHTAFDTNMQDTTALSAREEVEKEERPVPAFEPFTFH